MAEEFLDRAHLRTHAPTTKINLRQVLAIEKEAHVSEPSEARDKVVALVLFARIQVSADLREQVFAEQLPRVLMDAFSVLTVLGMVHNARGIQLPESR